MIRGVLGSRASIGGVLGNGRGGAGNGLLTGLVGYWALDEAGGANNALDKHSGGLTLTQASSPGADTGKVYSTARTFNGSGQYFSRASETALQVGDIDFAIAAWIYPVSTASFQDYVHEWHPSNTATRSWLIFYNSTAQRIRFIVQQAATSVASADTFGAFSTGQWYLVIAWHDATANTVNICVNNGAVDSVAHTTGVNAGSESFMIGGDPNNTRYSTARIGPVMFWKNRTLSATARAALYNGGNGLAYSAFTA